MKKPELATASTSAQNMDVDPVVPDDAFGSTSHIIQSAEGSSIHKDNVEFLQKCGQKDILDEQQKLLKTLGYKSQKILSEFKSIDIEFYHFRFIVS